MSLQGFSLIIEYQNSLKFGDLVQSHDYTMKKLKFEEFELFAQGQLLVALKLKHKCPEY